MRHAWLICLKDLRQRLRDHTALIVAVIAPLALTALIGTSLSGSQGIRMRLGIADLDGSPLSHAFVDVCSTSMAQRNNRGAADCFAVGGSSGRRAPRR